MGITCLLAHSEGVLTLIVVNTAISVSILREIVRSLLCFLRIRGPFPATLNDDDDDVAASPAVHRRADPALADQFRARFKPFRFGRRRAPVECRVCLSRFEPDSVVNRLNCDHLFHRACLEMWLDYHHATCPLCRSHVFPTAADSPLAPGSSFEIACKSRV